MEAIIYYTSLPLIFAIILRILISGWGRAQFMREVDPDPDHLDDLWDRDENRHSMAVQFVTISMILGTVLFLIFAFSKIRRDYFPSPTPLQSIIFKGLPPDLCDHGRAGTLIL